MSRYSQIQEFEERLRSEYQKEFADEQALANELFELYLEAAEITCQQWRLKPERVGTMMLINRTFNDLHAGWKLIMEGMLTQGMTLLRDTIECAHYIKLFEVDTEYRDKWIGGKGLFLRDVRQRMKKNGISPPPQDQLYRTFSEIYTHPSKKGTAAHVWDWYPVPQEHWALFMYGGVKDLPRTRLMAHAALTLLYFTIYFLWQEMFTIGKGLHPAWHQRFASAVRQLDLLGAKAKQQWMEHIWQQLATTRKIMDEYLKGLLRP